MKNSKASIVTVVVILCAFLTTGMAFFLYVDSELKKPKDLYSAAKARKITVNKEIDLYDASCQVDSDCVIESGLIKDDTCCSDCGAVVIGPKAIEARKNAWVENGCSEKQDACPIFDCDVVRLQNPRCVEGQCQAEEQE